MAARHVMAGALMVVAVVAAGLVFSLAGQVLAAPAAPWPALPRLSDDPPAYDVRVDAGNPAVYTDTQGKAWLADRAYAPGGWGYVGGYVGAPANQYWPIAGTSDQKLYREVRRWRYSAGGYKFTVPPATYQVELRFAEIDQVDSDYGYRYMDVEIEGVKYLCMMDIVGAIGKYLAYDWTFVVTATDGILDVNFIPHPGVPEQRGTNEAFVSALRVTELPHYSAPLVVLYPRIGVGIASENGDATNYDLGQLHVGWYTERSVMVTHPRPNGMEYVNILGVWPYVIDWNLLNQTISASPGSTWIIGNEVEGHYPPAEYARIYYGLRNYILERDGAAKIGVSGIIEVSASRLWWLGAVLDSYRVTYGISMPVDIWTIHEHLVGEQAVEGKGWPIGTPPGIPAEYRDPWCNGSLIGGKADYNAFEGDVYTFRKWMKDKGYGDKPLWLTEYGVLAPASYGCTERLTGAYLKKTMQFLNTRTSITVGLTSDENRLVQRWNWYSVNDKPYDQGGYEGSLFYFACRQYPGAMTGIGRAFRDWVQAITPPGPTATPTQTPTPTITPTPTATRTPMPPGNGSLQGNVQVQGRGAAPSPLWSLPVIVRLYLLGDDLPAYQFDTTTDQAGAFAVPGATTPGVWPEVVYDVKVKNAQALQVGASALPFSDTVPTARDFGLLRGGDASNDNRVSLADLSILASSYGKAQGAAGYDGRADFSGDNRVSLADLSILASNYGRAGVAALAGGAPEAAPNVDAWPEKATGKLSVVAVQGGQTATVEVCLDAGSGAVDAAAFSLAYDARLLKVASVSCAGAPLSAAQVCAAGDGVLSFRGAALGGVRAGSSVLMRVTFEALAPTATIPRLFTISELCAAGECWRGDGLW